MFGIDDALMIGGMGASLFGAFGASSAARKAAEAQKSIAGLEIKANAQREQAMELNANRAMLQNVRMNQMARSVAQMNATSQGAQFGSGLQGGIGSISGGTGTNILGISQNLRIGRNLFDTYNKISHFKMDLGDAQSQLSTDQGLMSFGSSMMGASKSFGNLGSVNWGSLFSGGGGSGEG